MNSVNSMSSPKPFLPDEWYVYQDSGAHVGPVTLDQLARGIAAGKVPRNAFAGLAGDGQWRAVLEYPQVSSALQALQSSGAAPPSAPQKAASPSSAPAAPASGFAAPPRTAQVGTPQVGMPPVESTIQTPAAPAPPPASLAATVVATPLTKPAPAPIAASAPNPAAPVTAAVKPAAPAAKPEEKKEPLDPRFRFLPILIFGAFAFLSLIEVVVGLATG